MIQSTPHGGGVYNPVNADGRSCPRVARPVRLRFVGWYSQRLAAWLRSAGPMSGCGAMARKIQQADTGRHLKPPAGVRPNGVVRWRACDLIMRFA